MVQVRMEKDLTKRVFTFTSDYWISFEALIRIEKAQEDSMKEKLRLHLYQQMVISHLEVE